MFDSIESWIWQNEDDNEHTIVEQIVFAPNEPGYIYGVA